MLDIARGLRSELRLGEGPATDLIAIGLSATDYVGHTFGTQGSEMCIQLLALDARLGDFFQALDREGIDYAVVLTADHGGLDLPERDREQSAPRAARVDPALRATAMGEAIGRRLRLQGPVLFGDGSFGDIYVDRALPPRSRARALAEAVAAYRAHPQVEAVLHPRADRRDAAAHRAGRDLVAGRARPSLVRSRAFGRFLRDASAASDSDPAAGAQRSRNPWQRLGL